MSQQFSKSERKAARKNGRGVKIGSGLRNIYVTMNDDYIEFRKGHKVEVHPLKEIKSVRVQYPQTSGLTNARVSIIGDGWFRTLTTARNVWQQERLVKFADALQSSHWLSA